MQSSRDSSVLRSLALPFGEGLAFSVGMKLAQSAAPPAAAPANLPDFAPLAEKLGQIEQRIQKIERPREPQQFDQKVIHAIVTALETRLQEQSGQFESRLNGLEAAISATVQTSVATRVGEEAAALRAQVVAMHRDFAESVSRIVAEQVAARAAAIEPVLQERVEAAVAPLQSELTELRARMHAIENVMAEFVTAIGAMCRQAAGRSSGESPAATPESRPVEPADEPAIAASADEPVLDLPIPAFLQAKKPSGMWRIPIASSFLFAFTAIGLLLHAI